MPWPAPTGLSPSVVVRSNTFGSAWVRRCAAPTTPPLSREEWFGLFPPRSPLLRESRLISLGRATEMFQFAHCPPACLCIQQLVSRHHSGRVAPFGVSGLIARMQLPLNVSPVSASFIGLQRLGIHLVLSLACALLSVCVLTPLLRSRFLCSSLTSALLLFSPLPSPLPPLALLCFSSLFLPWQN